LESEQTLWNSYTIYEALVKSWLRREIRKMEKQNMTSVPGEQDLWAACRLVAVYLQSLGTRALSESELAQLIAKLPAVAHLKHLDFGGRSLLNRTSGKDYRFAHYSIQEFLVAHAAFTETLELDRQLCLLVSSSLPLPRLTAQITSFMRCFDKSWARKIYFNFNWKELKPDQLIFRDRLEDGGEGPEMMIIPPVDFQMESTEGEERRFIQVGSQQDKRFNKPFALSQKRITFDEFLCFYNNLQLQTHISRDLLRDYILEPYFELPLVELYAKWLSKQTGERYRLPSEKELGYVSILGIQPTTGDIKEMMDFYALHEKYSDFKTHPVGKNEPNILNLRYISDDLLKKIALHRTRVVLGTGVVIEEGTGEHRFSHDGPLINSSMLRPHRLQASIFPFLLESSENLESLYKSMPFFLVARDL
ncbi:MAG: hypothetical protein ACXWT4_19060, partial [Methylobacter sp.]